MSATTHASIDELADYLDNPHSEASKTVSRHLAQCATCRSQINTLTAMKGHLTAVTADACDPSMQTDGTLSEMLQSQTIERFVDGQLVDEERQRVKKALAERPLALKAALHYASHSAAMEKTLHSKGASSPAGGPVGRVEHGRSRGSLLLTAVKAWLTRRVPLWTSLPAAALATGMLLMMSLTFSNNPHRGEIQIASYQDNPVVEFRSASQAPGIGFFGTAARSRAPFGPVAVVVSAEGDIIISWPPVPQASAYVVRLARREKGGTTPLSETATTATTATFKGLEIINDHRYVWTLSGKTADQKDFYAEGGFVFHQADH